MNRVSFNHFVRVTWLFFFFISKFKISNFQQEEFLSEKYFRNWNIFKKEIFHKNEQTLHNQDFSYSLWFMLYEFQIQPIKLIQIKIVKTILQFSSQDMRLALVARLNFSTQSGTVHRSLGIRTVFVPGRSDCKNLLSIVKWFQMYYLFCLSLFIYCFRSKLVTKNVMWRHHSVST